MSNVELNEYPVRSICDAYEDGVADGRTNSGFFDHEKYNACNLESATEAYFYGRIVGSRQIEELGQPFKPLSVGAANKRSQTPIVDVESGKVVCLVPDKTVAKQIAYVLSRAYHAR